jgi:hypothetical protein
MDFPTPRTDLDGAAGAQRSLPLPDVAEVDAEPVPVPEVLEHPLAEVAQREHDVAHAVGGEEPQLVLQERLAVRRHHALGQVVGQRPQAGA